MQRRGINAKHRFSNTTERLDGAANVENTGVCGGRKFGNPCVEFYQYLLFMLGYS